MSVKKDICNEEMGESLRSMVHSRSPFHQSVITPEPDYPFNSRFGAEIGEAAGLLNLNNDRRNVTDVQVDKNISEAVDVTRIVIFEQFMTRGKDIDGVMYYPIEAVGIAALVARARANSRANNVLSKWRELLGKNPHEKAFGIVDKLSEHLGIDLHEAISKKYTQTSEPEDMK